MVIPPPPCDSMYVVAVESGLLWLPSRVRLCCAPRDHLALFIWGAALVGCNELLFIRINKSSGKGFTVSKVDMSTRKRAVTLCQGTYL